jgi:SnoaL-like domain
MNDIERLTITEEIRRVMARYVRYADYQRWEDLAGLFTPAGTFTPLKPDGSVWLSMSGRAEIAKTLAGTAGPGDVYIHHLGSSEIDAESANSASGIFNMEDKIFRAERGEGQRSGIAGEADFSKMEGYGHYHGEFVKIDGAWYIAKLTQTRLRLDFTS